MFLKGRKSKAKSIVSPLGDVEYAEPLPAEEKEAIVQRLLSDLGTDEDRRRLFDGHVRLGINIAARYAAQCYQKDLDLVSEALLTLWESILVMKQSLTDTNFTPWCVTRIHSHLYAFITRDTAVPVPYSTYTRHRRLGKELALSRYKSLDYLINDEHFDPEEMIETREMTRQRAKSLEVGNNQGMLEITDMIDKSIRTEAERRVIHYRMRGFNDKEIAEKMDRSVPWVSKIKRGVEARFEQLERSAP